MGYRLRPESGWEILLFEANATMVVEYRMKIPPAITGCGGGANPYRRAI
jgi:hypothetical protein